MEVAVLYVSPLSLYSPSFFHYSSLCNYLLLSFLVASECLKSKVLRIRLTRETVVVPQLNLLAETDLWHVTPCYLTSCNSSQSVRYDLNNARLAMVFARGSEGWNGVA